ncbi:MAG: thioredoxin family protein [Dethiobacteria bacterium]|jgi:hypothetical protein
MSRINVKVLEPEKEKCEALLMEAIHALTGIPICSEVEKIHDKDKIKKFNVEKTPGLVINNKVKVFGRFPEKEEIKKWILEEYNLS